MWCGSLFFFRSPLGTTHRVSYISIRKWNIFDHSVSWNIFLVVRLWVSRENATGASESITHSLRWSGSQCVPIPFRICYFFLSEPKTEVSGHLIEESRHSVQTLVWTVHRGVPEESDSSMNFLFHVLSRFDGLVLNCSTIQLLREKLFWTFRKSLDSSMNFLFHVWCRMLKKKTLHVGLPMLSFETIKKLFIPLLKCGLMFHC